MSPASQSSRMLPVTVRTILNTLLDRSEQSQRQKVVRVHMDEIHHPDYYNPHEVQQRRGTNATLRELENQNIVRLHWQRFEENNWLSSVDLVLEHRDMAYELLGRTPHSQQESMIRRLLAQQTPIPGWHAAFLEWVDIQLTKNLSVSPLDLQNPSKNADLLRTLAMIAQLNEPVLERILSIRLFNNSKRLEVFLDSILLILRHHDPDAKLYGNDKKALLLAHHVARVPEHVLIAGSLILQTENVYLDITPFQPSVALSATTLRTCTKVISHATQVITVENATSFTELAAIPHDATLLVFTGGFASPAILRLLRTLHNEYPEMSFFHWGDLDVGGLRILEHLRRHLDSVTPLGMNTTIFEQHLDYGQVLSEEEQKALQQLRNHSLLQDCIPVIDLLLSTKQKLEQEAIRPTKLLESSSF